MRNPVLSFASDRLFSDMGLDSNSLSAAEFYWDAAAESYEQKFSGTVIGQTRRRAVWDDLERVFRAGERVLELNCGTGIDAVFLTGRGVRVLACDISPRMIELAQGLAESACVEEIPDFRVLATEKICRLAPERPFDGAFSNFSGLNCVEDLSQVAKDVADLLKPGARFLVCMMGRFVPWEIVWFLAHGQPRRAVMRLHEGRSDYQGTTGLKIQRPTVAEITRQMEPSFRLLGWKGIGITVPPSYTESVASRFPKAIGRLAEIDRYIGHLPFFRSMADCVLLEFERTTVAGRHVAGE
jgi:SAM-dependent methyltransferase